MGIPFVVVFLACWIASAALGVGSNFCLAFWSNVENKAQTASSSSTIDRNSLAFVGVYSTLGLTQALLLVFALLLMAYSAISASTKLHRSMLYNILRSPMIFFETTPLGRILNRCGKASASRPEDVDTMDYALLAKLQESIDAWMILLAAIATIVVATPIFLLALLPLGAAFYFLQRVFRSAARQLGRLEAITRSQVCSNFEQVINGAATIRAYRVQEQFINRSRELVDANHESFYLRITSNRWGGIYLELLGNLAVLLASVFLVVLLSTTTPGVVGLCISCAMMGTRAVGYAVRGMCEVETNVVSVERIEEYSATPTEASWESDIKPPPDWPSRGHVVFEDYSVRYRPGLDCVLRNLSCQILPAEKIGIVGRTGAGKSSLVLALFRVVEAASGRVLIDDIDIATIGLHALRLRISIIPQDPAVFTGTIRTNLDPFARHSDDDLWTALEKSHLGQFVAALPGQLGFVLSEGGENLSSGQRQLVCLARALLRKAKIVVLDEATASIDMEADELIQRTMRTEFQSCTVVTIAHRLNTIMDSTRIAVLEDGRIVEFDSPARLLANRSHFFELAKEAGISSL